MTVSLAASALSVFVITVLILRILIPKLKSLKMGQKILEIGPRWHKSKEGTPTMGGISFIVAVTAVLAVYAVIRLCLGTILTDLLPMIFTYLLALLNGLIGVFDDYVKLRHRQNEGLKPYQKLALQLIAAVLYLVAMGSFGFIGTSLLLPFFNVRVELGFFYYILCTVFIMGIVNSANLTDGIDGLVSSVTIVIMIFFAVCSYRTGDGHLAAFSGGIIGACAGFLVYNFHPARVFMGDTGSLFLGGACVGAAFMMDNPLIIALAGLIFIIEALSDIIQVFVYKLTHKRVFKMAPIHHHFEKSGWGEVKIVAVFSAFTLICCAAAALSLFI